MTNEKNEPVPAVLGVAVVDDALLNLADDHTPAMTTHFLLTSEIEKPEDLEKADFYLSDETKAACRRPWRSICCWAPKAGGDSPRSRCTS